MGKNTSPKTYMQGKESTIFIDFVRATGVIPLLIWKRPKVYYVGDKKKCFPKGGVLIASNHITYTDPLLLYGVFWRRRLRFLATKELYKNNFIAFLFSAAGCIQVDKENFNMSFFRGVVDKLKKGGAIMIFPEGQINQEGKILSYKLGAVLMAQLSGAPIQPVYVTKREKFLHRNIALVGEPIDVCSMCSRFPTMDELAQVNEFIRKKELELEEYYYTKILNKGVEYAK